MDHHFQNKHYFFLPLPPTLALFFYFCKAFIFCLQILNHMSWVFFFFFFFFFKMIFMPYPNFKKMCACRGRISWRLAPFNLCSVVDLYLYFPATKLQSMIYPIFIFLSLTVCYFSFNLCVASSITLCICHSIYFLNYKYQKLCDRLCLMDYII